MRNNRGDFWEEHIVLLIILMMGCVLLNNIITSAVTAPHEKDIVFFIC